MAGVDKLLKKMRSSPQNVRFKELGKVCEKYFGEPRQQGSSHQVYKTPWPGDPRANIQKGDGGKAKAYQVRQVIEAIDKLEASREAASESSKIENEGTPKKK